MRFESIGQIFRNTNGALKVIKLLGKPTRLVNSTVIDTRARSFERMHVVSNVLSFMRDWRLFTSDEFARGFYNRTLLFVARKINLTRTRPRKKGPPTGKDAFGNRYKPNWMNTIDLGSFCLIMFTFLYKFYTPGQTFSDFTRTTNEGEKIFN